MKRTILHAGGILDFDASFISKEEGDQLIKEIKSNVKWEQKYYTNSKGEKFPQPRQTAWYADSPNMEYSYSGVTQTVSPWFPALLKLKEKIEEVSNETYNSVLLNHYRTGNDSVGAHADDEKELVLNAGIASVSLGASRKFRLSQVKHDPNYIDPPECFDKAAMEMLLTHGSLLVMSGTVQQYWKHSVPKMPEVQEPRINLTFRRFKIS